jgi:hypothetical protein
MRKTVDTGRKSPTRIDLPIDRGIETHGNATKLRSANCPFPLSILKLPTAVPLEMGLNSLLNSLFLLMVCRSCPKILDRSTQSG